MNGVRSLVPFLHVMDLEASVRFYDLLGFSVQNETPTWRWLQSGDAALMLAQASHPIDAGAQGVLFYVYVEDVTAKHAELLAADVPCSEITYPAYNRRGEFRISDPDGYAIEVTHVRE